MEQENRRYKYEVSWFHALSRKEKLQFTMAFGLVILALIAFFLKIYFF